MFATVAILCLGFGVGLNATIFSLIDGVLLKPYPYTEPDRLLIVGEQRPRAGGEAGISYLDMRDWKEANSVFTTIAGVSGRSLTIADSSNEPERYLGAGSRGISFQRSARIRFWAGLHRRGGSRRGADVVLLGATSGCTVMQEVPTSSADPSSSTTSRTSSLA